jgi:hypothetical protein
MRSLKLTLIVVICIGTVLAFSRAARTGKVPDKENALSTSDCLHPISDPVNRVVLQSLHSGDIIFRDGRGAISSVFRKCSLTDHSYSHAGVLHIENGIPYVYHLIGGEGRVSFMRKDLMSDFCRIEEANAYGIFRCDLDPEKIDSMAGHFYREKIAFDAKFDLSTDDKMYCTEMVYKILTKVSGNDNFIPLTTVNNIKYCSCDNIFLSPHFTKIYSSR